MLRTIAGTFRVSAFYPLGLPSVQIPAFPSRLERNQYAVARTGQLRVERSPILRPSFAPLIRPVGATAIRLIIENLRSDHRLAQ